jgi:hypothetical protein
MRAELPEERDHGVTDIVVLLANLCIAVAIWSCLADVSSAPLWKVYGGVGPTFFLTLAGLTRRSGWAHAIRFLMGIWTVSIPYLLGVTMSASALSTCIVAGSLLIALSVPGVIGDKGRTFVRQIGVRRVFSLPP